MSVETSPAIAKITQAAAQLRRFHFTMLVQDGEVFREIFIDITKSGQQIEVRLKNAPGYMDGPNEMVSSVGAAFAMARSFIGNMTPLIGTCAGSDEQLCSLIRTAWCEMFGIDVNTISPMTGLEASAYTKLAVSKSLNNLLDRGGESAVKTWNSRPVGERIDSGIDFTKRDFSIKDWNGIELDCLNWGGSKFDQSEMIGASIENADCGKCSFRKCNLRKARLSRTSASKADFSAASMEEVVCHNGTFKNAIFKGADLSNSCFREGDIRGADFSGSTTDGAIFQDMKFDEKTVLPADFPFDGLIWKGTGVDPRQEQQLKDALGKGVSDYDGFIEQIDTNFDSERIDKALKMLQKERFKLFSRVDTEKVIGIVRSQSDEELVYSCLLTSEGHYTCCTQNLKACGGLRGALCKHLLVLIIGLTKSDVLVPNQAATWVLSSKFHQPKIDKDMMGSIFLEYKGALVGDIDWRPTETIPEDYYT